MKLDVHHYFHFENERNEEILHKLDTLLKNQKIMSAQNDAILSLLSQINDETNALSTEVDSLVSQIQGGLSADEATAVTSRLQAVSDSLKAIAAKNPQTGETTPATGDQAGNAASDNAGL